VRVFVWEETRDDGDGKQYKSRAFMSPDVPRREIRSQSLDRDVNGLPGHETELVGWGCAPEEARPLAEARKESMDERKESEKRTDIERLARQGRRIEQAWRKHQAEPNDATRAAILATGGMYLSDRMEFVVPTPDSRLMHPRWMIFQRPAPRAEKALLAIAKTNDPKLSVWAATQLVYMARDRHAPLLLRKLLEHKSADRRAVAALANTQVSPRPVLEALRPPLDDMPLGVVPHAHDGDAVTELLERYEVEKKADGHNTEECLEQLSVYDDPRVRALFAEMASRLKPEDGAKIGRVLHARVVLMAAATLHIKGSRKLLLRCIEWWIEDKENRFPEMRGFVGGGVAAAALLARDPVVTAALDRALKATPSPMALWMIAGTQEQDRAERQIRISADHLRQATAKPLNLFMGVAKEKELLPAMLPLCEAPSSETLARLLELYFPEYDPKLDFAEIYALKYKSWYSERVGRKAPDMKPWGNDLKTLCNALPWFGDDGLRILMHMGDYPPYRGAVLAAVRRIQPRTDELRAFVARQKKEILGTTDMPDEWPDQGVLFELGLTLWCYGDTEFRRHCEALLLRPPSHHVVTLTCDALAFLPRAEIVRLARLRHELGLPPRVLYGVAAALSHHGDKECGRLILELWDEVGDAGARPHFGACMNRVAGRNFGLRRRAMEDWALFPDGKKRDGRGPTH
jgi:hypothetical protein